MHNNETQTSDAGLRTVYRLPEAGHGERASPEGVLLEKRILACYDACSSRLDAWRLQEAIDCLAADLDSLRATASQDDWKIAALNARRHPTHARLLEDPYLWAAFNKPRGYPGDAHTLDFVYGYRTADAGVSRFGRELLQISTAVPIADAVRARRDHIAKAIQTAATRAHDARIVSIACGHMRELHRVSVTESTGMSIFGVDHDPLTLEQMVQHHRERRPLPLRASVKDILAKKIALPDADLIYVAGLYDYLADPVATALTAALAERLRPEGLLLILNLSPANTERGCMEAVWDWWLVYRGVPQIEGIARAARTQCELAMEVYEIATGRVSCLSLSRMK